MISSEELEALGQIMIKQLKNRYNDPSANKRFVVGVDRSRMKLFDIEDATGGLMDDTATFDKTNTAERFKDFKME